MACDIEDHALPTQIWIHSDRINKTRPEHRLQEKQHAESQNAPPAAGCYWSLAFVLLGTDRTISGQQGKKAGSQRVKVQADSELLGPDKAWVRAL
jgi:hypothetical protein